MKGIVSSRTTSAARRDFVQWPVVRNEELEASLDQRDPESYLVYADWLQANGSRIGELLAVAHGLSLAPSDERLQRAEARLIREHLFEVAPLFDVVRGARAAFATGSGTAFRYTRLWSGFYDIEIAVGRDADRKEIEAAIWALPRRLVAVGDLQVDGAQVTHAHWELTHVIPSSADLCSVRLEWRSVVEGRAVVPRRTLRERLRELEQWPPPTYTPTKFAVECNEKDGGDDFLIDPTGRPSTDWRD